MSRRTKKNRPQDYRDLRRPEKMISGAADQLRGLQGGWTGDNTPLNQPGARKPYVVLTICVFLVLVVVLVFGQTLRHGFIDYDDNQYVYKNPQVKHGLTVQGIVWALTAKHASNWHPLTWLSHMLDCQLFGLAPWGPHLVNVLLHAATA